MSIELRSSETEGTSVYLIRSSYSNLQIVLIARRDEADHDGGTVWAGNIWILIKTPTRGMEIRLLTFCAHVVMCRLQSWDGQVPGQRRLPIVINIQNFQFKSEWNQA
jgi:hypothetical protein